ncbi:a975918f-cced-4db2-b14c-b4ee306cc081-CDS [Sclerotinia trifoliorum]|uniref:A975918f-cced-4db2-b14c-b4ee306cc081-CDS n=1 Tax=Sclerotinia trifoliorum TaxID=28548 RepID=A0A8H2ZML0_9HELO|nr:a975918f-cced-4db2-b14c-b4ee306cc081-CDS [Sclerotinia trifoliorum]
MHLHVFNRRFCLHWVKIESIEKSDHSLLCCQFSKQKAKINKKKKSTIFGMPYKPFCFSHRRNSSEIEPIELPHPSTDPLKSVSAMDYFKSTENLRDSIKNGSEMEHFHPQNFFRDSIKNGSMKECVASQQILSSSKNGDTPTSFASFPEKTRDLRLPKLSVNATFQELPGSNADLFISTADPGFPNGLDSSSPSPGATLSPWSPFKRIFALLDISESLAEADSTSIKELPCHYSGGIGPRISQHLGPREATFDTDHHSSKFFNLDSAMDSRLADTRPNEQHGMEPLFCLPFSPKPSYSQPSNLRQSLCPAINTDIQQFRDLSNSFKHRELQFTITPQLSSPDTATTNTSGDSFPSDSGYDSAAPDPCYTSTTGPGSFYIEDEESEFDDKYFAGARHLVDVSEFHYAGYLDRSSCLQPTPINDPMQKDLLDTSSARHAVFCSCQAQGIQALCFLEHGESGFEATEVRVDSSCADARMAQSMTDVDIDSLCNSLYTGDEPEILPPAPLRESIPWDIIIPKADALAKGGAAIFTSVQDTEIENHFDFSLYCEEYYASAPPWSAENIRGFDWNVDFSSLPDSQLQMEEGAKTPVHDTPSPKSESKSLKCDQEGCTYEPSGQYQWRKGNLARHKKETHNMKSENRLICDIKDCKETFTRISNLNVHLENKHGVLIVRKTRNRRSSVAGIINKPKAGRRITKAPKTVALTNIPECNRSQSVPGIFGPL